ncbi:MAG: hypothetical protein NW201_00570 [Gemmatimonadales bacterium]|nr:hypothetical protein [Gemmatimonadales bacterium]
MTATPERPSAEPGGFRPLLTTGGRRQRRGDGALEGALYIGATLDIIAVIGYAFLARVGAFVGFPRAVHPLYSLLLAGAMGLSAAAALWLAMTGRRERGLLYVMGFARLGYFLAFLGYAVLEEAPWRGAILAGGGAATGAVLLWWLVETRN